MNFSPTDPAYSVGYRRVKTRRTFARLDKEREEDDHARLAALGRMLYHGGEGYPRAVPQFDATTVEVIAWFRESGTRPGFMNRRHRKSLRTR